MSFSDRSNLTIWQKLGCFTYLFLSFVVLPLAYLVRTLGGCPAFATSDCEPLSAFAAFLWFPGSVIIAVVGGWAMLNYFLRNKG